jgi:uncharacterized membrane protein YgcG
MQRAPPKRAGLVYRTNDARCAEAPRATGYLEFEPPKMLQPVEAAGAAAFFDFLARLAFFALGAAFLVAFLAVFFLAAFFGAAFLTAFFTVFFLAAFFGAAFFTAFLATAFFGAAFFAAFFFAAMFTPHMYSQRGGPRPVPPKRARGALICEALTHGVDAGAMPREGEKVKGAASGGGGGGGSSGGGGGGGAGAMAGSGGGAEASRGSVARAAKAIAAETGSAVGRMFGGLFGKRG